MKRVNKLEYQGGIENNEAYVAESIEEKMRKVMAGADTVDDTADIIYTKRAEGVLPQYDIRTDRFEIAMEAMDKCSKTILAKREERVEAAKNKEKKVETPVTE